MPEDEKEEKTIVVEPTVEELIKQPQAYATEEPPPPQTPQEQLVRLPVQDYYDKKGGDPQDMEENTNEFEE